MRISYEKGLKDEKQLEQLNTMEEDFTKYLKKSKIFVNWESITRAKQSYTDKGKEYQTRKNLLIEEEQERRRNEGNEIKNHQENKEKIEAEIENLQVMIESKKIELNFEKTIIQSMKNDLEYFDQKKRENLIKIEKEEKEERKKFEKFC